MDQEELFWFRWAQVYKNQGKSRFRAVSAVKGGDGNAKRNDGASANAAVAHA